MKRYRFRLESVARVRRVREEQARAELLESRRKLDAAQEEMRKRIETYEVRPRRRGAVPVSTFSADRDHDSRLADAVTAAMAAETAAQSLLYRRVDEWVAAARETATLDRLDRRRREEHEAEVLRDEQKELDDLAAGRSAAARDEERSQTDAERSVTDGASLNRHAPSIPPVGADSARNPRRRDEDPEGRS